MTDKLTPYQKKILKRMANGEEPETYSMGPWTRAYRFGNEKQGIRSDALWSLKKADLIEWKSKMTDWGLRNFYVITQKGKDAFSHPLRGFEPNRSMVTRRRLK